VAKIEIEKSFSSALDDWDGKEQQQRQMMGLALVAPQAPRRQPVHGLRFGVSFWVLDFGSRLPGLLVRRQIRKTLSTGASAHLEADWSPPGLDVAASRLPGSRSVPGRRKPLGSVRKVLSLYHNGPSAETTPVDKEAKAADVNNCKGTRKQGIFGRQGFQCVGGLTDQHNPGR